MIMVYIESVDSDVALAIAEYEFEFAEDDIPEAAWTLWKFRVVGRGVDTVFHEYGSAIADHCPDAQTKTGGYEPENKGNVKLTGPECYDALRAWFDDLSCAKQLALAREILDVTPARSDAHGCIVEKIGWIEHNLKYEAQKDTA